MTIYELGSSLDKLLSTLKKNRENVPLETLKTYYRIPYESLIRQINETASDFVKMIVTDRLLINPDVSVDEQAAVINQTIQESGMLRQMGRTLYKTYDVQLLHQMALELRKRVEDALYPYIALKDCLVADLFDVEKTPIIYNTITKKVYENDTWVDQELDLTGKLLIYIKSNNDTKNKTNEEGNPNEYTKQQSAGNDYPPVAVGY